MHGVNLTLFPGQQETCPVVIIRKFQARLIKGLNFNKVLKNREIGERWSMLTEVSDDVVLVARQKGKYRRYGLLSLKRKPGDEISQILSDLHSEELWVIADTADECMLNQEPVIVLLDEANEALWAEVDAAVQDEELVSRVA